MEISKSKIKCFGSLWMRKHRLSEGLFVAEGEKCVGETLPFFKLHALVATSTWLESHDIPAGIAPELVFSATSRQMSQISSLSTPPSILAVYELPISKVPSPTTLREELVLALDGVQDPGNMGTIMRTADWFGVRHIIASTQTVDIFNPKAVQATMGAIGRVKVYYTDLPGFIKNYKEATSLPVFGTLLNGQNIYSTPLSANGLIVMGNEGKGLSAEVRKLISSPVLIPHYPPESQTVESLNVAMATAITLAEFRRQLCVK